MKVKKPEIKDGRKTLPRHASRKWGKRKLTDIKGIVLHQTAGNDSVTGTAKYHVGPNHISDQGCPAICYTYYVDQKGTIHQCNDHESVTWSQGGGTPPLHGTRGNNNYLAIVCGGDFSGPGHNGRHKPTEVQLKSVTSLILWLQAKLKLPPTAVFGHYHFGKRACPGTRLEKLVEELRSTGLNLPKKDAEWQQMLADLGFDLGEWGPNKDGVDGDWGNASRQALVAFQRGNEVHNTGYRDKLTATALAKAHEEAMNG